MVLKKRFPSIMISGFLALIVPYMEYKFLYPMNKTMNSYSVTANVDTLIFTPSTFINEEARATVVAPVVNTSSTTSTCLPTKDSAQRNLKIPSIFSQRSEADFTCLRFLIFLTHYSFRIYRNPSHGSNPLRYPFTLVITTNTLFPFMKRNRNNHINSLEETRS